MATGSAKTIKPQDIAAELLEQGKQQQPAAVKPATTPTPPKPALPKLPPTPPKASSSPAPTSGFKIDPANLLKNDDSLAWLERSFGQKPPPSNLDPKKQQEEAAARKAQIEKMAAMDKKRSREMYEQIMAEIKKWEKLREQEKRMQTSKHVTGKPGFDEERVKDPESFWEKMKKKKEEAAKKLPWSSKQSMGTGEITRGVSG